ncbi:phage protein [Gluconobacter frateurii M-2]|nr:phage protein [Gluconobacter frateurii M-2]
MPIKLKIGLDAKALRRDLSALADKEIPRAEAASLNRLAFGAFKNVQDRMQEVFDRPTRFTLFGFKVQTATPKKLEAAVITKDLISGSGGTPAIAYLGPQIHGGSRDKTKLEKHLSRLAEGQYVVPGRDCPLDGNGNVPRSLIVQVLSRLGAASDPRQILADKTARRLVRQGKNARGRKTEYFVARDRGNGRPKGIYKLIGPGQVGEIFRFVSTPHYKARLPVDQIVNENVARRQDRIVNEEIIKVFRKRGLR